MEKKTYSMDDLLAMIRKEMEGTDKSYQRLQIYERAKLLVDLLGRVRCMPIAVQRVFYRVAYVFFIYLRQKGLLRRGEGNWPSDVKGELRLLIKEIIRKYD